MPHVMFSAMIRTVAIPASTSAAGVVLVLLLSACAPSADEVRARHAAGSDTAVAAAAAPSAARGAGAHDSELVAAVALGKTKLPVDVRFRLAERPVIGQPVTIELVVTPAQLAQIRGMQFHLQPDAGLLLQGDADLSLTALTPGMPVRREIVVVPQASGVIGIELVGTIDTHSESLSQTYAIPLVVQPPANPG